MNVLEIPPTSQASPPPKVGIIHFYAPARKKVTVKREVTYTAGEGGGKIGSARTGKGVGEETGCVAERQGHRIGIRGQEKRHCGYFKPDTGAEPSQK
ncbi:hypothetical protein FACS1894196_3290 [Clostridia bacterium]|nr:hypothetical protein FACS1894196_3290 [Clostridia bacterium]